MVTSCQRDAFAATKSHGVARPTDVLDFVLLIISGIPLLSPMTRNSQVPTITLEISVFNSLHAMRHFSGARRYTALRYAPLKWLRGYTAPVLFTSESFM